MSAPKVLMISPIEPKADGNGVEKRGWSHLEGLAAVADVHLVIAMFPAQDHKLIDFDRLRKVCKRVDLVLLERKHPLGEQSLITQVTRKISEMVTPPFHLEKDSDALVKQELANAVYDVLLCFRLRSHRVWEQMQQASGAVARKVYVDFDDIESLATKREIPYLKPVVGRVKTALSWLDMVALRLSEQRSQKSADGVVICSDADKERLEQRGGKAKVHVIPNSYPETPLLPARPIGNPARILFLGTMAYPPNVDGIVYFYNEVLPLIRQKYSGEIHVDVVGHRPDPRVLELDKDPSITVTGGVPSVLPYYESADIVIAPIRFGGGTRIKILETLSYGRPLVSTTIGAEGLGLTDGKEVLIADETNQFADACLRLLADETLRTTLITNGRQKVLENFSLPHIQDRIRQTFMA